MELLDYKELKREAYIEAVKELEEEYSNDHEILRKLEEYKNKHLNEDLVIHI